MKDKDSGREATEESVGAEWESLRANVQTRAMDFSVDSLVALFEQGDLVIPNFARPLVWNRANSSLFIESLLLNIPIPSMFFAEDPKTYQYAVLDGTQRIHAVISYLRGEYALTGLQNLTSAESLTFRELPLQMQRYLLRRTIRVEIITSVAASNVTAEVFSRLNTGGVNLTTQELRNALHQGPFNSLTLELSEEPEFQKFLKWGPRRSLIGAELALRYFALLERPPEYPTLTQEYLTQFLQEKNRSSRAEVDKYRKSFTDSLQKCGIAFGDGAFRRWRPARDQIDTQFSNALFEAQMVAVERFSTPEIISHADQIRLGMRRLFDDAEFDQSLRSISPSSLRTRVNAVARMIESIVR